MWKHGMRRVVLAAIAVLAAPVARAEPMYEITDLGTLGGTASQAYGMNDVGRVVGSAKTVSGQIHAFLWDRSTKTMVDLGTLGGTTSEACDTNNNGQVVGYSHVAGNTYYQAFVYESGSMTGLAGLGGSYSSAGGINDSGQIAGWANTAGGAATRATRWDGGSPVDLGSLGGPAYGEAINSAAHVVGKSYTGWPAPMGAFLHDGTSMSQIHGTYSTAHDINDSNQVVGYAHVDGGSLGRAYIQDDTGTTYLPTLGGSQSYGYAINGSGWVVGWADRADDTGAAFLYDGTTMHDLSDLVEPGHGWTLFEARDINAYGDVVGWGANPAGETHAFLLTIPEPATMSLLAIGGLGVLWRRRR